LTLEYICIFRGRVEDLAKLFVNSLVFSENYIFDYPDLCFTL